MIKYDINAILFTDIKTSSVYIQSKYTKLHFFKSTYMINHNF